MKPLNQQGSFGGWVIQQPKWVMEAYHNDGLVNHSIKAAFEEGLTDNELWCRLAGDLLARHRRDQEEIIALRSIAPKRMRNATGEEWVWHCPDHLIPVT